MHTNKEWIVKIRPCKEGKEKWNEGKSWGVEGWVSQRETCLLCLVLIQNTCLWEGPCSKRRCWLGEECKGGALWSHIQVSVTDGYGLSVGVCVRAQVTVFVGQCMQGVSILCVCLCRVWWCLYVWVCECECVRKGRVCLPVSEEVQLKRISHSVGFCATARWLFQAFLSVLGGEGA